MAARLYLLLLILPCRALAQMDNASIGFSGGSLNFHQNGSLGMHFSYIYNLVEFGQSSISISQGLTFGSEDEYGISFPILFAAGLILGPTNNDPNLHHGIATFADFPLLLHYNFGAGARRDAYGDEKLGFYIGGGATHTFTGYTNTFAKAAQTDYWALVIDGGIRFKSPGAHAWGIGLGIEQPQRSPIGPIRNPLFFQMNLDFLMKN